MTYNLHPIFVHFPIAFLLLYSAIKIFPFGKIFPKISFRSTEIILLIVGVLGASVAIITGEVAEDLVRPDEALVDMHSLFAVITMWVYSLLLLGELLFWVIPKMQANYIYPPVVKFLVVIRDVIKNRFVQIILPLVGLIAISVTGLLGGVMVYGLSADPIAGIVLKILGIDY